MAIPVSLIITIPGCWPGVSLLILTPLMCHCFRKGAYREQRDGILPRYLLMYSNHTRPERLTPIKAILALISVCCCPPEYLIDPLWFLLNERADDEGSLVRYDAFSLSVGCCAGLWAANHPRQALVPGSTAVLQSNYGLFTDSTGTWESWWAVEWGLLFCSTIGK